MSQESRLRNALAAAVVAVALAGGGYLIGRESRSPPPPSPAAEVVAPKPQPAVVPEAVLGRSDLIGLAALAADQFAGGPENGESLTGRRFLIRIPFGCQGPAEAKAATGWTYDEDSQTLRVRVAPTDWSEDEWVAGSLPEGTVDAVEGFSMPRPWTRSEDCPAASLDRPATPAEPAGSMTTKPEPPIEPASSVGVAHFFAADSNRTGQRRGRPFEVVAKVAPDDVPSNGLRLVLEGRIGTVPGRTGSTLCHAASPLERPTCLIAVEFERIAVLNPMTGAEIANWRP